MTSYLDRRDVIATLDAAYDEQTQLALDEEEKPHKNATVVESYLHAATIIVELTEAVREIPEAPLEEEKD